MVGRVIGNGRIDIRNGAFCIGSADSFVGAIAKIVRGVAAVDIIAGRKGYRVPGQRYLEPVNRGDKPFGNGGSRLRGGAAADVVIGVGIVIGQGGVWGAPNKGNGA